MTAAPTPKLSNKVQLKGHNIAAVASGKGGVGKTWFAITLSHALAKKGFRTLLFDGDLGLANLDIQLGLMPKNDLGSVISGRMTLKQTITHYNEGNFDIIAGRSGSGSLANIPASRLQILSDELGSLSPNYDRTIIDLGAGVEKTVRALANNAGSCLVLATDEPTSLTDAYAFIKVTHTKSPNTNIKIIINKANSTREGERTYNTLLKACEGFLKISPPLLGIIRRDAKVREAIRSQSSILTRFPNTEASSDVESIVTKLSN